MKKKFALIGSIVVLALVCVLAFAACTPSVDSLTKKYEGEGYTVASVSKDEFNEYISDMPVGEDIQIEEGDIDYIFTASKGLPGLDSVTVIAFTDSSLVKDIQESYDKIMEELGEDGSEFVESIGKLVVKGNAVAVGRGNAIDLF